MTQLALADELMLLGGGLYQAQRLEFLLYGIASHATHIPAVAADGRFRELTPEQFLRGDPAALKATLGALATALGDALLLDARELSEFVDDRNLIAHNFWRTFHASIRGSTHRTDAAVFLRDFLERGSRWEQILRGCLAVLMKEAADAEGRSDELQFSAADDENMEAYRRHAAETVRKRA